MMKLYEDPVLEAAAYREAGDSAGAWKLAGALLEAIPAGEGKGGDRKSPGSKGAASPLLIDKLSSYADKLAEENIQTPAGGPYSVSTLDDLRDVAMAWPADKRYPQAAFRTHMEVGAPFVDAPSPFAVKANAALKALCTYAAGGAKRKPTELDSGDWAAAIAVVDTLVKRKAKYTVSANALRLAVGRKRNTPDRDDVLRPVDFSQRRPLTGDEVASVAKSLPKKEKAALFKDLVTTDPDARKNAEAAVREVKSEELAQAHRRFQEEHAGKRESGREGGPDDAAQHTLVDQPLSLLGILIETEPMKEDMLPKVIRIVSEKRELLDTDAFDYLREFSATMRQGLDTLDALVELGTGLTDEAIAEGLLRGER
jgi:hypothetical protein